MKRRPPVLLSLALMVAHLVPGAILEALLHLQRASLRPEALLVAYLTGALAIVFPMSYLVAPHLLRRCRLAEAAARAEIASLHALQLVIAFLPPWQISAHFGAHEVPRFLLTAGGAALLLLLTDPIFRSFGPSFFEE